MVKNGRILSWKPQGAFVEVPSRRNKIGLLGPFSFGNLGNAALQQTLLQYLNVRYPDAEFYGCYIDPDEPAHAAQPKPFPISRYVPWPGKLDSPIGQQVKNSASQKRRSYIREWVRGLPLLRDAWIAARNKWMRVKEIGQELAFCLDGYRFAKDFRFLAVGLGGVFDEVWGGKWGDLYYLFRWTVLATMAGTPVLYLSVGVEEINTRLGKFFCRKALSMAAYRSFRDEESKRKIETIGVKGQNRVFPDLAFGLKSPYCSGPTKEFQVAQAVGVSPMAYCDPRFWPVKNLPVYREYLKSLSAFVAWLLRDGREVVLLPTQIRMDRIAVEELKALVLQDVPYGLRSQLRDMRPHSVDQALALLSQLKVFVTSRLHGVVLASLTSTPVLAISPASKIDRLMEDMELTDYVVNIGNIELLALTERFKRLEDNREIVRGKIQRAVAKYKLAVEAQFESIFGDTKAMTR